MELRSGEMVSSMTAKNNKRTSKRNQTKKSRKELTMGELLTSMAQSTKKNIKPKKNGAGWSS
jgi:hypothetical protein